MDFQEDVARDFIISCFIISHFMIRNIFFLLRLIFIAFDLFLSLLESAGACWFFIRCKHFSSPDGFQLYTRRGGYPVLHRCFNFINKIRINLQGATRHWCNSKVGERISLLQLASYRSKKQSEYET